MLRKVIIGIVIVMVIGFSQGFFRTQSDQIRLSPKLLNYQGFLTDTLNNPVTNPSLSILFEIYDASSAGNLKWSETQSVAVSRGIFSVLLGSVTPVPDSVFTKGTDRWLQLVVGGQVLTPRTRFAAGGYAYTATYSDTAEYARNTSQLWERVTNHLQPTGYYGLGMRGNAFYGIYDSTHVNLGVACTTGISGQDNNYITVGGGYRNKAQAAYSVVAGGYVNSATGTYALISGGRWNTASGFCAGVGSGDRNIASGYSSCVSGGLFSTASGAYSFVGAGWGNQATGDAAGAVSGLNNIANAWGTFVGGGTMNRVNGIMSVVAGGDSNQAGATSTDTGIVIVGGHKNTALGRYSAILGGYADTITAGAAYSYLFGIKSKLTQDSTFMVDLPHIRIGKETGGYEIPVTDGTNGQALVTNGSGQVSWTSTNDNDWTRSGGNVYTYNSTDNVGIQTTTPRYALDVNGVICGGANTVNVAFGGILSGHDNQAGTIFDDSCIVVVGGAHNQAAGIYSFIGGGYINTVNGPYIVVAGGGNNQAAGIYSFLGGGSTNTVNGPYCAIMGGELNTAANSYSVVAGGAQNYAAGYIATVAGGVSDSATGAYTFIGGGWSNKATADVATVSGGLGNRSTAWGSTIGGGASNLASGSNSVIAGGNNNQTTSNYTAVGGGYYNRANGISSAVAGGTNNVANYDYSFIGGGYNNTLNSKYGGILTGGNNTAGTTAASDSYTTVVGGLRNKAEGDFSFIGGGNDNYAYTGCAVAGGAQNLAYGYASAIAGGLGDTAFSAYTFIGGGFHNKVISGADYSVIAGGMYNRVDSALAVVAGGDSNFANGRYSAVAGGYLSRAEAWNSFAVNYRSRVPAEYYNSSAFNGTWATAVNQTSVSMLSKISGSFTIDHPLDPDNKILNHYFVESPDMSNMYSGSVVLDASGRAKVDLPDYFDALNKNPRVQLTGVGSSDVVYVAEDFNGNQFTIGGKPGMKVYWTVVADRKDMPAEVTRLLMPVEQPKTGGLAGHSINDNFLVTAMIQLEKMGYGNRFQFRNAAERQRFEELKRKMGLVK